MSRLVIRPLMPVPRPDNDVRLTLFSRAILRTNGDERMPPGALGPTGPLAAAATGCICGCACGCGAVAGFASAGLGAGAACAGFGSGAGAGAGLVEPSPMTATTVLI